MKKELLKQIDKKIESLDILDFQAINYWNEFREMVFNFKPKQPKKSIKDRADDFYQELTNYTDQYSPALLRAFYNYWTEHNRNGKKMRFEMEKVFDVSRRLATWERRSRDNNQGDEKFTAKKGPYVR